MSHVNPRSEKTLVTGQKLVAAAGTQLPLLAAKKLVWKCKIRALTTNAGAVFVGDSTVDAATGYPLAAGVELDLDDLLGESGDIIDLSKIYVDAATNADGVAFIYFT